MAIVTISRGSYSKGKEIAEKVADRLGYECVAREALLEASEHFDIPETKLVRAVHDAPSILDRFAHGKEKYVAYIQAALTRHVQKGNVVYHGLAGHFLLQGISHVLKVRISAATVDRVHVVMERDNVSKKDIQPYVDTFIDKPLIADSLNPIPFTEEKEIEDLGVSELRLSNGIRVILKPTDFKNDEVLFTSFSPGGHSLVPDENYIAASTASSVIAESGVGDYNRIELNKFLSGKIVSVSPWINSLQEGISGSASPEPVRRIA